MNTNAEREAEVVQLLSELRGCGIPDPQMEEMKSLAEHGEFGIAFENLCTQLYEYGLSVSPEHMRRFEILGRSMGIEDEYWTILTVAEGCASGQRCATAD